MRSCISLLLVVLFLSPTALLADDRASWNPEYPVAPSPPADDSTRLSQLEAETKALRAEMRKLREQPVRLPEIHATPTAMSYLADAPQTTQPEEFFTLHELQGEMKKYSWKNGAFSIVPYGCLWGNMVYSTERTVPGSYTLFTRSASTGPESEFIIDARSTRLGFDVTGPRIPCLNCAQSGGKVEIDFQSPLNAISGENKATVMLRHAYVEVKDQDFRLLIGQTWDVISPLYPGTIMYSVGWDAGNIGYRRAQLRGERYLNFSDVSQVTAQLALASQVFSDNTVSPTAGAITGEASNWPVIEGRVAWTIGERGPGFYPITVGLSGHIGEQEFDTVLMGLDQRRRTWSGNLDVRVPLGERLGIQGECQIGENLGTFLGGIGQGIDPITLEPIRDVGGWIEVWYDWTPTLHSHVGYSIDNPNDNDLHLASQRSYNQFFFGNLVYDVTKSFLVGVEVSSWKTLYMGQLPGDSVRCEFMAKYGF